MPCIQLIIVCSVVIIRTYGDDISESSEPRAPVKRSSYLPATLCSRDHISSSLRGEAPCQPRDKVIVVPWPNNTDVHQLTPTHVTVKRCSGGCHQDHQSCVAFLTKTREVPVILGKCPVSGGKCEKECTSVEVKDEVECGCGCRKKQSECGENHVWKSDTCTCECGDSVKRTECLEGGVGRVWDSTQCDCVCPVTLICHNDMKYDQTTCSCQPSMDHHKTAAIERKERSDSQHIISWEFTVICVLACLLLIFIFIIITLLSRIHILKRHIKSSSSHIPCALSENLYTACPVSQGEKTNKNNDDPYLNSPKSQKEKTNLHLFTSSSDISSTPPCCSDKHTDSSFCSDSSDSGHASLYRQTPTPTPTHPSYHPTQHFQYRNLAPLQEDAASECCSLMGKETPI